LNSTNLMRTIKNSCSLRNNLLIKLQIISIALSNMANLDSMAIITKIVFINNLYHTYHILSNWRTTLLYLKLSHKPSHNSMPLSIPITTITLILSTICTLSKTDLQIVMIVLTSPLNSPPDNDNPDIYIAVHISLIILYRCIKMSISFLILTNLFEYIFIY